MKLHSIQIKNMNKDQIENYHNFK